MKNEIDLKPYIRALLRRWWIIISVAAVFAVIAGVSTEKHKPLQTASASLVIVPVTEKITLNSRFTDSDSQLFTTYDNRRTALINLARDGVLEARVAQALTIPYQPGSLRYRISVSTKGDLMQITASAETNDEAQRLAMVWAQEYARLVAEVYARDVTSLETVEQQLVEAQQRYQETQAKLESFLTQGKLTTVGQEVQQLTDLVDSTRSSGTNRFTNYLRRSNNLEQILRDARLLRERLADQADEEVNTADAIAVLLLQIRNLSDQGTERPILQIDSSLTNNATVTKVEIDRLIAVLEDEYRTVRSELERLSETASTDLSPAPNLLLIERLNAARVRLEQLQARQRELERHRDIAFDALQLLTQRAEELHLSSIAQQVSVRYIGTVTNPIAKVSRQTQTRAAVGALAGIILAAAVIVAMEVMAIARRGASPQPEPTGV